MDGCSWDGMDGWDGRMEMGWDGMDGWIDEWIDGWMDVRKTFSISEAKF